MSFHTMNINEVILLPRKLYKTQTEIMTIDARRFTKSNHTKSCRFPVPRFQDGRKHIRSTKNFWKTLPHQSGLKRCGHIWKNYFKDVLNLGVSGDRVENVLWRPRNISLQQTTLFVIIHSGTNNVDQSQPEYIAVGVMKIVETFMKNQPKITTIITGMLPRNKTYS